MIKVSNSPNTKKEEENSKQNSSKVLLVCVYDTIVFQITNEMIVSKFQEFGTIMNLLIFQKGQVTKFFIEFQNSQAASEAKVSLNGTKLMNSICKMAIHFSNFNNVDVKHQGQNSDSSSYRSNQEQLQFMSFSSLSPSKLSVKDENWQMQGQDTLEKIFSPFNSFSRSKTDNPIKLQRQIKNLSMCEQICEEIQIQHSIKKSIDNLLGTQTQLGSQTQNSPQIKVKDEVPHQNCILSFKMEYHLPCYCIYNLFSNFGNISCIVAKKNKAYIKFRTPQFSAIASTYLNSKVFLDNFLQFQQIIEKNLNWEPQQNQFCQCQYFDSSYDRFTPQRSITINPPSNTLHLSSMKKEVCKESYLRKQFEKYGIVEKVHILKQSKQKNMALVKFRQIEDSFAAIGYLHNQNFMDRKIQISFTKSKI